MSATPEREPIVFTPEHQARIDASREEAARLEREAQGPLLAGAIAGARRIAAAAGMPTGDLYGGHCENCEERWALPADKATCAHRAICEDCWPNGCPDCIADVEAELQRRQAFVNVVTRAAESLREAVLDLTDSDLAALDWRVRADLLRHVDSGLADLRQISDRARAKA